MAPLLRYENQAGTNDDPPYRIYRAAPHCLTIPRSMPCFGFYGICRCSMLRATPRLHLANALSRAVKQQRTVNQATTWLGSNGNHNTDKVGRAYRCRL